MLNIQLSSWVPGLFTRCGRICLRHTNTQRIYWRKWCLEMFSVVSEFSFVRSLNSALYHEHYIGNSEWVNRERFRTQLRCAQLCMCGRSMFHTCGPLLNMSVWKLVRYASAPNRAPRTETVQYKYMYRSVFPAGFFSAAVVWSPKPSRVEMHRLQNSWPIPISGF